MGESIDPIDYDVVELRELARVRGDRYVADGFLWSELPDSFPPTEGTAEYDRPATWTGSLEERQKPYLRRLPEDGAGDRIAREWVQGLVERSGSDAAIDALAYYESLGWLTEAVREELEGYLLAVGYRPGGSLEDLTRADHVESLASTARLARLVGSDAGTADGSAKSDGSTTDERGSGRGGPGTSEARSPARMDEPAATGTGTDIGTDAPFGFEDEWIPAVPLDDADGTGPTGRTDDEGERDPRGESDGSPVGPSGGTEDRDDDDDEDATDADTDDTGDAGFRFGSGVD